MLPTVVRSNVRDSLMYGVMLALLRVRVHIHTKWGGWGGFHIADEECRSRAYSLVPLPDLQHVVVVM